ncbi:hypothetical protein WLZ34_01590 [Thermogladius sp. KZ2Tp1]
MLAVKVRGRDNYLRYTLVSWLLEVKDLLERELCDNIQLEVEEGENELP